MCQVGCLPYNRLETFPGRLVSLAFQYFLTHPQPLGIIHLFQVTGRTGRNFVWSIVQVILDRITTNSSTYIFRTSTKLQYSTILVSVELVSMVSVICSLPRSYIQHTRGQASWPLSFPFGPLSCLLVCCKQGSLSSAVSGICWNIVHGMDLQCIQGYYWIINQTCNIFL